MAEVTTEEPWLQQLLAELISADVKSVVARNARAVLRECGRLESDYTEEVRQVSIKSSLFVS